MAKKQLALAVLYMLFWLPNNCFGQSDEALSSNYILNSSLEDSIKINRLLEYSKQNLHSNPERALEYCNTLYKISDSLNIQTGIIDALTQKSKIFYVFGSNDTARMLCEKAIRMSDSLGDIKRMAYATYHKAVLIFFTEGPIPATEVFKESYKYYRIIADTSGMANTLNGIGATFFEQAKYDSTMYYYLKTIQIAEANNYSDILGKVYLNLGLVYGEMNETDEAKACFKKSIPYNEEVNNQINIAKAIHNTANVFVLEGDFDSAWLYYNKALEFNLQISHPEGIANAYIGLGDVSDKRGNYGKASEFFKKAKYQYGLVNNQQGLLISYKNMGMIEWRLGNYNRALKVYDSSLMIARELGLLTRELEIYGNICENYVSMGDFRNAYTTMVTRFDLNDSIMNVEKQEKIADLEIRFEKEKDKAQILALTNENLEKNLELEQKTRQRNTYLFSGSGIVLFLIFLFSYYSQRTRKNRIIAEQRIHQLEEEKKLLAARSIVEGQEEERKRIARELHDGLGVLLSSAKMHFTSIRDKSPESQAMIDKATKLLEQATGDVRRISHNMMPGLLTKYGLYEAVEDLLEQVDEMEGIHAEVKIEGEQTRLKENTEIMLYRIIQEMVNNSLKHAEASHISLAIDIKPDKLRFVYSDDGKGFDPEEQRKVKSIGLTSIFSRVKFLGGEVTLISKPGKGTSFEIMIPA